MNKTIKILFFLLLSTSSIFADEIEELLIEDKQLDRIDINYAYTYIHPHSNGTINEGVILYDHKMWKGFTTLFQLGFYDRKEGKGTLGTVSAFWDWSDEFYTFTSYAHGTKSSYLPNNKVEQTFFYKCGCERNFIVSLGLTYIGYYHDRSDISVIPGVIWYCGKWIFSYNYYYNTADPGNMHSSSHKFSIQYGAWGDFLYDFDIFYGRQAYLLDPDILTSGVDRKTFGTMLKNRNWIGCRWGILSELGYVYIEAPVHYYRASVGAFFEF
jgi:YaiO family outer membrane protein